MPDRGFASGTCRDEHDKHQPAAFSHRSGADKKREAIYHAVMLDPHTSAELSIDDIRALCDELIEAHGKYMAMYK